MFVTSKNSIQISFRSIFAFLICVTLIMGAFLFSEIKTLAAPNYQMNYQGKLLSGSGAAVPDDVYNMRFWLLTSPTAPTSSAIWTESLTGSNKVQVSDGLFSIMLGSTSPLSGVDFNQTLYLGVEIGGTSTPGWDGEMSPRKILGTVPSAFEAENASTVGGVASTSFLRSDQDDTATGLLTFANGFVSQASSTITGLTTNIATTTTLVINGDQFTDLTGTSLVINNGVLSVATSTFFTNSAQFAQWLSDETGTGNAVFSASPTFTGTAEFASTNATNASSTYASTSVLSLYGRLYDGASSAGTNGQILLTTGSGVQWIATSSLGLGNSNWLYNGSRLSPSTTVGIGIFASSTIGDGTGTGGLTISGGATTTGNAYFGGTLSIGSTSPSRPLTVLGDGYFSSLLTANALTALSSSSIAYASATALSVSGNSIFNFASSSFASTTGLTATNAYINNVLRIGSSTLAGSLALQGTAGTNYLNIASSTGSTTLALTQYGELEVSGQVIDAGINWTPRSAAGDDDGWSGITYGNGMYVAVGQSGSDRIMTSPDGINWATTSVSGNNDNWVSVVYANGLFVVGAYAIDSGDALMTSPDGVNWTVRQVLGNNDSWNLTYGNGLFVGVGLGDNRVMTSPDGVNWTARTAAGNDDFWNGITYGNGLFVAVGYGIGAEDRVMTSPDGINWTARTAAGNDDDWYSVTYGNGLFVAVGPTGDRIMTSPDGINWTARTAAGNDDGWQEVTYGNGIFVAVGETNDTVMTSPDGINWTARTAAGNDDDWQAITYGNGQFVAVGVSNDRVMTSGKTSVNALAHNNIYQGGASFLGGTFNIGTSTGTSSPFFSNILNIASTTGTSLLTINSNGNVGIGTTTPSRLFAIGGDARIANTLYANALTAFSSSTLAYASATALTVSGNLFVTGTTSLGTTTLTVATSTSLYTTTLGVGTDYLTDLTGTGLVNSSGVLSVSTSTFFTNSAGFAQWLSDETGTGNVVFSASPTFTGTAEFASTNATNASSTYASTSVLSLYGRLYDSASSAGTNGMVLQTTATGVVWVATSTLGISGSADGASNWLYNGSRLSPSTTVGIGIFSSSTIGDGTATGGLTVSGGATTTNLKVTSLTASRALFTDANNLLTSTGVSQNIIDSLSDETGSGALVFSVSPSFTGLPQFSAFTVTGSSSLGFASATALTISGNTHFTFASGTALTATNLYSTFASSSFASTTGLTSNTLYIGNNLYIGTTTSLGTFTLQGSGTDNPFVIASSSGAQLLTVRPSGNIGIGTSTPTQLLTVDGSVRLTGWLFDDTNSTGTTGYVLQTNNNGVQWVSTSVLSDGASNWVFGDSRLTPSTTVGIGIFASSTIGNGTGSGGLTISGNGTTTGTAYIGGNLGIGSTSASSTVVIKSVAGRNALLIASSTGSTTLAVLENGNLEVNGRVLSSGIGWTARNAAGDNDSWNSVAYGNGVFVAVGYSGDLVMYSYDGLNWATTSALGNDDAWTGVTYGNGLFVAVSYANDHVMTSPNGINWTARDASDNDDNLNSVTYGNGTFVAVAGSGSTNAVITSKDGITWTGVSAADNDDDWYSVTYGNGTFVAVSFSGDRVMTSPDGTNWTVQSVLGNNDSWNAVTYGNGLFVAVGGGAVNDHVMTSPDGINWTVRNALGDDDTWWNITYGGGLFVAVGDAGDRIMTSPDGINWTKRFGAGNNDNWYGLTYGNGMFVAVGASGDRVMISGAQQTRPMLAQNILNGGLSVYGPFNIGTTTASGSSYASNILNIASTTGTSLLTINSNGNVGIGTTTPSRLFAIGGDARIANTLYANALTAFSSSTLAYASATALTVSGNLFVTGTTSLGTTTLTVATSTSLYTTTLGVGTDYITDLTGSGLSIVGGALTATGDGLSNWLYNGSRLSPSTTVGIGIFSSSTIGDGTATGGLTISGGATTTGNAYFGGTVGIGSTSPSATLTIQGSGTTNPFAIASTSGSSLLTVLANGNVGIGSSSPTVPLTVKSSGASGDILNLYNGSGLKIFDVNAIATGGQDGYMRLYNDDGSIAFSAVGDYNVGPHVVINASDITLPDNTTSNSGMGIYLRTPQVNTQENGLYFANNNSGYAGGAVTFYTTDDTGFGIGGLKFKTSATHATGAKTRMVIDQYGNIGIGTTTTIIPASLFLQGASSTIPILTVASSSGTGYVTVLATGNVGISSTTPSRLLTVAGDIHTYNNITAASATITYASTTGLTSTNANFTNATTSSIYATTLGTNSEYFTDLTGTGLINSSGVLSVSTSTFFTTSAQFAQWLSDETGTGNVVFSASPTFTGTAEFARFNTTNASSTYASTSVLSLYGPLYDGASSAGTNGMVLQTTGSGVTWVATSSLGITAAGDGGSHWLYNGSRLSPSTTVGIGIFSSSTIGDGTATGGLTISGGATTTGNAYFGGKIGIGTTTMTSILTISSTTQNQITLGGNTGSSANISHASNDHGIGIFGGSAYNLGGAIYAHGNDYTAEGPATQGAVQFTLGSSSSQYQFINHALDRYVAILTDAGNFGLGGTTTPSRTLTVIGDIYGANNATFSSSTLGYASATALTVSGNSVLGNGTSTSLYTTTLGVGTDYLTDLTGTGLINSSGVLSVSTSTFFTDSAGFAQWLSDETGTGNVVFSASPTFTGTALFASLRATASSTIGDGTATGGLTISGNGTTTRNQYVGSMTIGTTSQTALLTMGSTSLSGSRVAGIKQYFDFTNSELSATYFGNEMYIASVPTATSTLVGSILRIADTSALGNTVRGFEAQAFRGTNTKGENTGLSGFGRTFGVRGTTLGDAGAVYVPAGVFAETEGTTQGNALRAYSGTITTEDLVSLFHDTSAFTGTGLVMNFGNSGGSFAATSTGKFADFQIGGTSRFTVTAGGTTTIGATTSTSIMAGLQIVYGGLCVDNDGSCTATTTGRITSVSSATGNSDLAEIYFSNQSLRAGEIVSLRGGLSIERAKEENQDAIIGVVSTKPGLLLGFDDTSLIPGENGYPVGLKGRVPIKLSTENGPIKKGDKIGLSSIPGVGMKATASGTVVGVALEDYDGDNAYSRGFLNQFGDDMVRERIVEKDRIRGDIRAQDGCSYGGGNALGEASCVKDPVPIDTEGTTTIDTSREDALRELKEEEPQELTTEDGETVLVGQALMFIELEWYEGDTSRFALIELGSPVEENETETFWDRLKALALGFKDGVLALTGLKAQKVETSELCVDGVCLNADDLRALLNQVQNDTPVDGDTEEEDLEPAQDPEGNEDDGGSDTEPEGSGDGDGNADSPIAGEEGTETDTDTDNEGGDTDDGNQDTGTDTNDAPEEEGSDAPDTNEGSEGGDSVASDSGDSGDGGGGESGGDISQ